MPFISIISFFLFFLFVLFIFSKTPLGKRSYTYLVVSFPIKDGLQRIYLGINGNPHSRKISFIKFIRKC